ncbi:FtsK/SpoIIIE domain-containing protein, partial [Kibdelosporangium lantanae]
GAPASFDYHAAPVLRAWRRRWGSYVGPRWKRAMDACELTREHRRSGMTLYPRVVKVRAYSPTVDTVVVRLARGQSARSFEDRLPELADTLMVERVAVERVKPGFVGLVIQRGEAFTEVIPAPDMPEDSDAVDLRGVYVADTEYDSDFLISPVNDHVFIAGATGAGKNSIPAAMLRAIAPLIRDGLVRLWIADPKQNEFAWARPIAYRYASDGDDSELSISELITEFRDEMAARQAELARQRKRKCTPSTQTPLDLLILDEMGAIMAYSTDRGRGLIAKDLAVILTQGRATCSRVIGLVQEPTKDTVPVRDLFTMRIALRLTTSAQVDMVLGENARLRGALADEIPAVPETAGIGYVVRQRSRIPMRIRAAYVDDTDLNDLVRFVLAGRSSLYSNTHLKVVA